MQGRQKNQLHHEQSLENRLAASSRAALDSNNVVVFFPAPGEVFSLSLGLSSALHRLPPFR